MLYLAMNPTLPKFKPFPRFHQNSNLPSSLNIGFYATWIEANGI